MLTSIGCSATPAPRGDKSVYLMENGDYGITAAKLDEVNAAFQMLEAAYESCLSRHGEKMAAAQ